jgi:hypothetical protein
MATLRERLDEAEQAYHDLQTGKAVVEFRDGNGEQVRYTAANRGALSRYIESLKSQIAGTQAGPMRPFFL